MSAPYRYALALTEDQAVAVEIACETLARIGMGQLAGVGDHTPAAANVDGLLAVREALRAIEPLATGGLPPNASHGIASERVAIQARRAWEVYTAVRECLARQHPEHCICVAHGPHLPIISGERQPRCEEIE
jgi:hypothetical protein